VQHVQSMNRRRWQLLGLAAIVVIALVGLLLVYSSQRAPKFNGTALATPSSETDFTLVDQTGNEFTLSGAKGKVVVLTFLYAHCTDVCPFIAAKLKRVQVMLGNDSSKVVLLAVTVDPQRDTIEQMAAYSQQFGHSDSWHFLTGTASELQPIWEAYYVGSNVGPEPEGPIKEIPGPLPEKTLQAAGLDNGLDGGEIAVAQDAITKFGGGYEVIHSTPIWLIDPKGEIRVSTHEYASPAEIVHDIRLLLP
jgi:protein SCO1/2